jgi:sRNA-binding protein
MFDAAWGLKMSSNPILKQEDAYLWTMKHGARSVDLRYEPAGFQSGWAVYAGGRLVERCAELMQARRVASALFSREDALNAA